MIGNATRDTLDRAGSTSFSMETDHSEESWALSVGASGRYLGRIGPDNIPVCVSEVVYGRMLMFSMTSTADESEIRGTISAAYNGLGAGGGASLSAKQHKILEKPKIAITAIGGPAEATQSIIRSGNLNEYFTRTAALSTAVPLSYTFRNFSDGTIATGNGIYAATANANGTYSYRPFHNRSSNGWDPYTGIIGDINGDGRQDMAGTHPAATNRLFVGLSVLD